MTTKLVVLGSNSFSGASFIDHALKSGHEVIGMSRSQETPPFFPPFERHNSHYQFHQLDLNQDLAKITEIMESVRPEFVVNFAAQSMVAESWQNPLHWFNTNVMANIQLHEYLRKVNYLKKYVHISTPEVYGNCIGNITENAPYSPSTPYAVSRAACDMSLQTYHRNYGFPVVFTRAANVYGPGQQLYRIIPKTILSIRMGQKLQLHGGGKSVRSFIHIQDVADATLKIAERAEPGSIFHLSTSLQISIRELVDKIASVLGVDPKGVYEVVDERPGKDAAYLLDSTQARNTLGWQDQITLDEGLNQTIAWVNDHFKELKTQPQNYIHKP